MRGELLLVPLLLWGLGAQCAHDANLLHYNPSLEISPTMS